METEKDMSNLHITDADINQRATEYISQIIKFIEKLISKGYAYSTEKGDVYFSVRAFSKYGKLSRRKVDQLIN